MKYLLLLTFCLLLLPAAAADIQCSNVTVPTHIIENGSIYYTNWSEMEVCMNVTPIYIIEYLYQNTTNQTIYLPNVTIINATYINNITYIINQTNVTQTIIDERIIYRDRIVEKPITTTEIRYVDRNISTPAPVVTSVVAAPPADDNMEYSRSTLDWKTIGMFGAFCLLFGGGGWLIYNWFNKRKINIGKATSNNNEVCHSPQVGESQSSKISDGGATHTI